MNCCMNSYFFCISVYVCERMVWDDDDNDGLFSLYFSLFVRMDACGCGGASWCTYRLLVDWKAIRQEVGGRMGTVVCRKSIALGY